MITMNVIKTIKSNKLLFISLQVLLLVSVYVGVKTYKQRDLVQDTPPLTATLLSGQTFNLQAQRDKPLLLHFWASWCPVCQLEQDTIESLSQDYSVVTVAMQSGEKAEVQHYMQTENLTFPVIVDPAGEISSRFGIKGVPISFILNREGKIVFVESGYTTSWGLQFRLWLADFN